MKKLISTRLAGTLALILLILLAVFHILVLLRIMPFDIIWGGQISDPSVNLYTLELMALAVTIIFILIIIAKINSIKSGKSRIIINIAVWIIFVFFILNTIANIASAVSVENLVFAPITLLLVIFTLRLAIEK